MCSQCIKSKIFKELRQLQSCARNFLHENFRCDACSGTLVNGVEGGLPCHHRFCFDCIEIYDDGQNYQELRCPACGATLDATDANQLDKCLFNKETSRILSHLPIDRRNSGNKALQ